MPSERPIAKDASLTDKADLLAFRIASRELCEEFAANPEAFSGQALPVTAKTWSVLHKGVIAGHIDTRSNLAWWLHYEKVEHENRSEEVRALAYVRPELPCFTGHFPGQPLLPGVVQLHWAVSLAASTWPIRYAATHFAGTKAIKFKSPVLPGSALTITLQPNTSGVLLAITTPGQALTSGQLIYRD